MYNYRTLVLLIFFFVSTCCLAAQQNKQQDDRQWSVLFYHGNTAEESINKVLQFEFTNAHEDLYSAELAYALAKTNPITRWLNYIFINRFQLAANIAARHEHRAPDNKWVGEGDIYFMVRRIHFPWDNYLRTSLAFGEGLSYASNEIYVENNDTAGGSSPRFLDFLTFEFTIALPQYPYLELVGRIHHRSGAWGTFHSFKDHPGSNNVGIGIRYYFK